MSLVWQSAPPSPKPPLRKGKSPKRCQWQKKRGDFEEAPRLAATTVAANRLARRWAGWHGEAVTEGALPPRPLFHKCLRRGTFCQQRQKVPKERRQNQWFWNPCAGVARNVSGPFIPANKVVQTRPVLSHCLGVYPPRRAPRLCCPSKQRYPLRLPCGAMWASRPTKSYR